MPTKDSKLPNKPLNGQELAEVTVKSADELIAGAHERLIFALRERLAADPVFGKRYAHPRVKIKLRCDFVWSNLNLPKNSGFEVKTGDDPTGDETETVHVDAVQREVLIDNPNLTRADAGLPFIQTVVDRPQAGESFGTIRQEEIPVETEKLPKPTPPVDTDKSEEATETMQVPEHKKLRQPRKKAAR